MTLESMENVQNNGLVEEDDKHGDKNESFGKQEMSSPSKSVQVVDTTPPARVEFKRYSSSSKRNTRKKIANEEDGGQGILMPIPMKKSKPIHTGLDNQFDDSSELVDNSKYRGSSIGFYNEGTGAIRSGLDDQGATSTNQQETEYDRDAMAIYSKKIEMERQRKGGGNEGERKIYHGQSAYQSYTQPGKYAGPLRGASNIRSDIIIDYARDICKDYAETGYCGYGDSCKFLHDRSNYKTGWQLDRDWDIKEKMKRESAHKLMCHGTHGLAKDENGNHTSPTIPFACFICRNPFKNPVVTKCDHYFCEDCALKHYEKDQNCSVCKEPTLGIFNAADKVIKRRQEHERKVTSVE